MGKKTGKITDIQTLKAIANPDRMRLYEALVTMGPATATQLAKVVPGAPGSLSYHLQQLARHGYIEEAPEAGHDRRERWWRAIPGGMHWSLGDFADSPGARAAVSAAQQAIIRRQIDRLREWQINGTHRWGTDWQAAAHSTDTVLFVNPSELRELGAELDAVLDRWSERSRRARAEASRTRDSQNDERAEVFVFLHAFPLTDGQGT
jgi:DNA-binding transcriptional ArsR family regulator